MDSSFRKKTLISYGLIIQAQDTKKWAIVRRSQTIEFIHFIRGHYEPVHLRQLLSRMTKGELKAIRKILLKKDEDEEEEAIALYTKKYGEILQNFDREEILYGYSRLIDGRDIITTHSGNKNPMSINPKFPPCSWPKGRTHNNEESIECAVREFKEEFATNLPINLTVYPQPVEDRVISILGNTYVTKCWVCPTKKEIIPDDPRPLDIEVSAKLWVTKKEAYDFLSDDQYRLLEKAESMLAKSATMSE